MNLRKISEDRYFVGESALWDEKRNCWFFVDIFAGKLMSFDPEKEELIKHDFDCIVSACVLNKNGELVLVTQKGIGIYDPENRTFVKKCHPNEEWETVTRYNDCKCDPAGRLFAGTMDLECRPGIGKLYRIEPDWTYETVMEGVDYSNGIVWIGDKMIYTDTLSGNVYIFDYDAAAGTFENKRILCTFPAGEPDGMAADDNGNLWIARWGGHGLACVDITSGEIIKKVELPVINVSSVGFGRNGGKEVLITTAMKDLSEKALEEYPDCGCTYIGEIGVTGPAFYKMGK